MKIITGSAILTCGYDAPKTPAPLPPDPTTQDATVMAARDAERKRRKENTSSTFLTSFSDTAATPGVKTLLGS